MTLKKIFSFFFLFFIFISLVYAQYYGGGGIPPPLSQLNETCETDADCAEGVCSETLKVCVEPAICGNGICQFELGESVFNCPEDCKALEEVNNTDLFSTILYDEEGNLDMMIVLAIGMIVYFIWFRPSRSSLFTPFKPRKEHELDIIEKYETKKEEIIEESKEPEKEDKKDKKESFKGDEFEVEF